MTLSAISRELGDAVGRMRFGEPVACVYNPLDYAWEPHENYVSRFGTGRKQVLLVGMNPGPFGMVQTGVPFGDVRAVRDFLGVTGRVRRPRREHPKRPVLGFECTRSEVSGARLWGWVERRFGNADRFFDRFFIANYCPLAFMEESGRNRTPDKLSEAERVKLFAACDEALRQIVATVRPEYVIGVGTFAEKRIAAALGPDAGYVTGCILHPSPASPKANRDWAGCAESELAAIGIELPR